jgi:hypothetical protein
MTLVSRAAIGVLLTSCLGVGVLGCGPSDNEKAVFETAGKATAEERAKPPRPYPTSQEEYNEHLAPPGPPGSYGKNYPFAKGKNRKLLGNGEEPKKRP